MIEGIIARDLAGRIAEYINLINKGHTTAVDLALLLRGRILCHYPERSYFLLPWSRESTEASSSDRSDYGI